MVTRTIWSSFSGMGAMPGVHARLVPHFSQNTREMGHPVGTICEETGELLILIEVEHVQNVAFTIDQ